MEHRTKGYKFRATEDNKGKKETVIEGDRISLLPEPIIHRILSLLPTRYAARTSVLSHKWNSLWSTFPVINLTEQDFLDLSGSETENQEDFPEGRARFIECLQVTLSRHSMTNLDIFKIRTLHDGQSELYEVVDRLVEEALKGKLKNLDLNFPHGGHYIDGGEEECEICYKLPHVLFLLGQSLLSLKFEGCNFVGFDKNLGVSFHLLKTLSIKNTNIEGVFLEKVICGSLAVETLHLKRCHGLKSFTIYHSRMKEFVLSGCTELEKCKIDAPGLHSFKYKGYNMLVNENWDVERSVFDHPHDAFKFCSLLHLLLKCVHISADTFKKMISSFPKMKFLKIKQCDISERAQLMGSHLTTLMIEDCIFEEKPDCKAGNLEVITFINSVNIFNIGENFKNLSSLSFIRVHELTCNDIQLAVGNCPHLSSLVLESCNSLNRIKIVSGRLESLVISDCVNVKEVRVLAHRLIFLKYIGPIQKFSRLLTSNKLEVEIFVKCDSQNHEDMEQFHLGEFLHMFSRCAESITVTCHCFACMNTLKNLSVSSPLCYLNLLKVTTRLGVTDHVELLQSILRISVLHKKICIDIESSSTVEMEFEGHTQEELMGQHISIRTHNFVRDHLIEMRITNFAGLFDDLRLVRGLICNATRLRKIVISIRTDSAFATETGYLSEVNSMIHNLPKASPDAEVIVEL